MPLKMGSPGDLQLDYSWGDGTQQISLQRAFLALAVISVPLMLIPYPIIKYKRQPKVALYKQLNMSCATVEDYKDEND